MAGRASGRSRRLLVALAAVSALLLTGCNDYFAAGWGNNFTGQLGTGTQENEAQPTAVDDSGALFDKTVVQADAGVYNSCALASDGSASCWGRIPAGAPPDINLSVPQPIPMNGVLAGKVISKVTAGGGGQCALTTDGTVACWMSPTQVEQHVTGVLAGKQVVLLDGYRDQGCAVTNDGVIGCWEYPSGMVIEPVQVNTSGVLAGKQIVDISFGGNSACALSSDGVAACWGANESGQLGNGTTIPSSIPVPIDTSGALAGKEVIGVSRGVSGHSCALTADGSAACWGSNSFGQLGDGTTTDSLVPVAVAPVGALAGSPIAAISAGGNHTCAVLEDTSAACWGNNTAGQLGNGSQINSVVPVAVAALPAASGDPRPVVQLASGGSHNMAVYQEQQPSHFVSREPIRVLDTRLMGDGAPISGQVGFNLQGLVPPSATAVTYNLVATGQTASGVATVVPANSPMEGVESSVINWSGPQQTIANGHVVKVSGDLQMLVRMISTGVSHFVVDLTGYYVPAGDPDHGRYVPANDRLYDSRDGDGPLPAGESRQIALGAAGVVEASAGVVDAGAAPDADAGAAPDAATDAAADADVAAADSHVAALNGLAPNAAAVNVTVTGTTGSGVVTVAAQPSTATSTVNWSAAGQTVANAVITDLSAAGTFTVTNNGTTPADVVVDLTGLFVPASAGVGASFYPTESARTLDTRVAGGLLAGGQTRVTTLPVPGNAVAVALNTTVTGTSGTGFVSVTPLGSGVPPTTSTVNWFASPMTRANGAIVPLTRTGTQAYVGGQFATHYVHDTAGFFR